MSFTTTTEKKLAMQTIQVCVIKLLDVLEVYENSEKPRKPDRSRRQVKHVFTDLGKATQLSNNDLKSNNYKLKLTPQT